jgi:hypothetical protein
MPTRVTRKLPSKTAWRVEWKGDEVDKEAIELTRQVMGEMMLNAERAAKARLWSPKHGVDTSTMKNRTHVSQFRFAWASEHIEPVEGGGVDLGGKVVLPNLIGKKLSLELGCGQDYTIYYHQKYDRFLRIPFDEWTAKIKTEVEQVWAQNFS